MTRKPDPRGKKEPWISIEGVLYDIKAGVMSVQDGMKEILGYFPEEKTTSDAQTKTITV